MGQFGNQPDFGTRAKNIVPTGNIATEIPGENLGSAALYIGTGGTLYCTVVGGNLAPGGPETYTEFHNIPDGTFFPVIVSNVWAGYDEGETTCSDIVALY
jgi:hypothetical protein